MKSIFSAFLGLLFIHLVLLGPLFILQQHRWKESMMQEIKSSLHDFEAEEIYFNIKDFNELTWYEGRKEFIFNGAFYDVIEVKNVYGGRIIKCIQDKEEDLLVQRFLASGKGEPNPFQSVIKGFWANLSLIEQTPLTVSLNASKVQPNKSCFLYAFSTKEHLQDLVNPPPNFL
jgi:hypothetical protein